MATRKEKIGVETIKRIEKNPPNEILIIWDVQRSGFGIRVSPKGRAVYFIQGRMPDRKEVKCTIGKVGSISPSDARSKANRWLVSLGEGKDPRRKAKAAPEAPSGTTVAEFCERYLVKYAEIYKKPNSVKNDRRMIQSTIIPELGNYEITEIDQADIEQLHNSLKDHPYAANRTLALLSNIFAIAERWEVRKRNTNPCKFIKKNPEEKREKYLSNEEFSRLASAVLKCEESKQISPQAALAIRLLIFTGCRVSEILSLSWEVVDLQRGFLFLPDSKTGQKRVILNKAAIALLDKTPRHASGWVIPGKVHGGHLVNLSKPWAVVRTEAKLGDFRLHDLRHTFASVGASLNYNLPILGNLLGHSSTTTTARYAPLVDDPARSANDAIGEKLSELMTPKKEGEK